MIVGQLSLFAIQTAGVKVAILESSEVIDIPAQCVLPKLCQCPRACS